MQIPEQFWKHCLNFYYLIKSDLAFSFTYFCLLVQDPVPFCQPIFFSTAQSHAAGNISHICTDQPACPCDSRADQACIWYSCWKSSHRNNFKPHRGPASKCLHHSSTNIISECICPGKYRTGYLCDTKRHFYSFLFFFFFYFGDVLRIVVLGRRLVHPLPLSRSRTVPENSQQTSIYPNGKQNQNESMKIFHSGLSTRFSIECLIIF